MELLSVIVAGIAAYAFGAVWYMAMAKPWMDAAGLRAENINRSNPAPYLISLVCVMLVAGMMRHAFAGAGIDTVGKGLTAGLGIGAFLALPWIATNNGFAQRPMKLTMIDGVYVVVGSAIIGVVLNLF